MSIHLTPSGECVRQADIIIHHIYIRIMGLRIRIKQGSLWHILSEPLPAEGVVKEASRKKETKNPPLLYNLAEIQNECSKLFKISPDQTLNIIQELYEKKLVTYPRTDARVLSTAVCKEI